MTKKDHSSLPDESGTVQRDERRIRDAMARWRRIEQATDEEMHRLLPDQLILSRLKREKLKIKDEIARLGAENDIGRPNRGTFTFPAYNDVRSGDNETRSSVRSSEKEFVYTPAMEEALDELEGLTLKLIKDCETDIEAANKHNRQFNELMTEIADILQAIDRRWRLSPIE